MESGHRSGRFALEQGNPAGKQKFAAFPIGFAAGHRGLLSALPTGASIFVVAQQYDVAVRRASATVALSTAVSVVTISVLFVLLGVK